MCVLCHCETCLRLVSEDEDSVNQEDHTVNDGNPANDIVLATTVLADPDRTDGDEKYTTDQTVEQVLKTLT